MMRFQATTHHNSPHPEIAALKGANNSSLYTPKSRIFFSYLGSRRFIPRNDSPLSRKTMF